MDRKNALNKKVIPFNTLVLIVSLFVFTFFMRCTGRSSIQNDIIVINDSIKVTTNKLIEETELLDPWCIGIIDTVLILGNFKGEPLLELFSTTGKPLKKLLQKGQGPHDVLHIGSIQVDASNKTFFIFDLFGKKILKYDLNTLLKNDNYIPELIYNFSIKLANTDLLGELEKVFVGKNFFVSESRTPKGRIIFTNQDMTDVKYYANIPIKIDENFSDIGNALMFSSYITMSPNQKYLAAVGVMAGMIDLYKIEKNGLDSIWSCYEYFPNNVHVMNFENISQGFFTGESINGYSWVCSSDDYVYALFTKKKFSEQLSNYGNKIRRINWKNQSIRLIEIDREIKSLCVSDDNKVIFGVGMDENGEPAILKIDLK